MIRKDVVGKEIEVGDYFIYTTVNKNTSLKFGKVVDLTDDVKAITVGKHYQGWERQKNGNEIAVKCSNLIVVPATALPSRIVDLLDEKI